MIFMNVEVGGEKTYSTKGERKEFAGDTVYLMDISVTLINAGAQIFLYVRL